MQTPAQQQYVRRMQTEIASFDAAYEANIQAGWAPQQYRIVPNHTRPGQFRAQQYAAMTNGQPRWQTVCNGTQQQCRTYVANQLR